ncbi:MAG TPA: hypothetical protein VNM91_05420 [Dehalococcoidia bacterium]|nr:hypothetical protein [Dehalococcoidia bacterium]
MPRIPRLIAAIVVGATVIAGLTVACGDDDDEPDAATTTPPPLSSPGGTAPAGGTPARTGEATPAAGGGDGATTIDVELREFSVIPAESSAPAGTVTFNVSNIGPNDPHEFVIIRTDLPPDGLPTDDNGAVPEDDVDVVDEVEELEVGGNEALTVDLEAGSYVLICNLVEEEGGAIEAHYTLGMRTGFTVE